MRRALAHSLLSFLLLTTLVWGGCLSCEQYFMFAGAKNCCSPSGHCKTKAPASQGSSRECKQIAFDHHRSVDAPIQLPVVAAVKLELPVCLVEARERWHGASLIEPFPPDLQILNSTFLI